ncbi:MAG: GSCFA domain-containing protein [Ferrovibrio sp.]|jgi:hypothetical protein
MIGPAPARTTGPASDAASITEGAAMSVDKLLSIKTPGQKQFIGSLAVNREASMWADYWHMSEDMTFFPREVAMFDDVEAIARDFVFKGYGPEKPIFGDDSKLITMGSCFADRLRRWLLANTRNAYGIDVPESLNNSFAVRQFIQWCLTGERAEDAYWYEQGSDKHISRWESEQEFTFYRRALTECTGIVVTVGMAEVWRDKATGGVFWRGVPEKVFEADKHECVLTSVEENKQNLLKIVELVHQYCGPKPIIFTLSPVPLNASFLHKPAIVSDCRSKSVLRVALGEIEDMNLPQVYYWPSFEIVRWVGSHIAAPTFNADNTPRHVADFAVKLIIDNFIGRFFEPRT